MKGLIEATVCGVMYQSQLFDLEDSCGIIGDKQMKLIVLLVYLLI